MLFAIALTLGCIRAWTEQATIERRLRRVLVVDVAVAFLLSWPAMFVILALLICALPRPLMSLEMLSEVAWTLELFVAQRALMNLRFGVLLPPGHRAEGIVIVIVVEGVRHWTLHRRGSDLFLREDLAGGDTYSLSILLTYQLGWPPIVTHPTNN